MKLTCTNTSCICAIPPPLIPIFSAVQLFLITRFFHTFFLQRYAKLFIHLPPLIEHHLRMLILSDFNVFQKCTLGLVSCYAHYHDAR